MFVAYTENLDPSNDVLQLVVLRAEDGIDFLHHQPMAVPHTANDVHG
ncbi:MAG TPA: hypothetical protein PL010_09460 [Flavobacteriales bacterium]|nr:hypothetical protein [Flavobacteriales bacterium]MCC6654332.1 hypothetical protein [Flavobacteriales bacterium]HMW97510.1 hypothetical protein [Flavobacteriales bacterium]HMZ48148.1 hypothetical protein [Flavobacteriales bacterium]HNA32617.1 hypothetical protein [Flavobacteriales bacterium]